MQYMATPSRSPQNIPSPHYLYVGYKIAPKPFKPATVNKATATVAHIVQTLYLGNDRTILTYSAQTKSYNTHVVSNDKPLNGVTVYLGDQRLLLTYSAPTKTPSNQVVVQSNADKLPSHGKGG